MAMQPHDRDSSISESDEGISLNEDDAMSLGTQRAATGGDDEEGASSSAANVIPGDKIANGLNVAKGFWNATVSRARKSIADLNDSEAMSKIKEASAPVVNAVVEGAKVAGEQIHKASDAAKPQFEAAGTKIKAGFTGLAEKSKPVLDKAGTAIAQAAEQAKPTVEKVGTSVVQGVSSATTFVQEKLSGKGGSPPPPHHV